MDVKENLKWILIPRAPNTFWNCIWCFFFGLITFSEGLLGALGNEILLEYADEYEYTILMDINGY